jgi:NAD(P)-dependent dehydrogenase (short-subunit alcohol dehydrogenase family)
MRSKVAVVTGASSGIGLQIAHTLLTHDYRIVAVSRKASEQTPLADASRFLAVDGDVGEESTAARAIDAARTTFGALDLLVNNAGAFIAKPFTDYTAGDYATLVAANLAGFFYMTQHALRAMTAGQGGHLVNIGTSLSSQPIASLPSALPIFMKGGLEAATRSIAIEYAAQGIRMNTIAAGFIKTPMHPKEHHAFLEGLSPARRMGTTAEIADAVLYLEAATFVSGEVLHVDGGTHAGK